MSGTVSESFPPSITSNPILTSSTPFLVCLNMQSEDHSDALTGDSAHSDAHIEDIVNIGFTITPQDTNILQHYLEEFQGGDTSARTALIDKIMGELYRLRPVNTPFDKKDARKVWHSFSDVQGACGGCGLIICYRKSRSGSTITTVTLGVSTSGLPASGLVGMPSINSIVMRCRSMRRRHLA